MCIAPHRTGEYGCCVFCIVFIFTFATVFFLASRWRHISHAGPLSLCLGGLVVVFVFAFMHLSYEDWQGLWSSVACFSYSETWTSHTCVCVCVCVAALHRHASRHDEDPSEARSRCYFMSSVKCSSLHFKLEEWTLLFFLRQDVNLYYILHLSSCDTCIFILKDIWLVLWHLFWIHASFSNCLHHFEFTFIFRHHVKETALCFATALLRLCST